MVPVTTQLFLPYNNTNFTTALYSIPFYLTVSPIFDTTFPTIAHRRRSVRRF